MQSFVLVREGSGRGAIERMFLAAITEVNK